MSERRPDPHASLAAMAAALLAILIWAGTVVVTRAATDRFDPLMVGIFRTVAGAVVALPVLPFLPRPKGAREWRLLVVSGASAFIGFPLLFAVAVAHTSASHAALIQAIIPLATAWLAMLLDRETPRRIWWLGAAVAMAGEVMLVGTREEAAVNAPSVGGDLLVLGAALVSAASYVAGGRLTRSFAPISATFWGIGLAGLALAPVAIWRGLEVDWRGLGVAGWALLLYLALGSSILGFIAWYWAMAKGGIARIAVLQLAMPVLSVLLAMLFLGETLSPVLAVATVAVIAGIALTRR